MNLLNKEKTKKFIDNFWDTDIIPNLSEFIRIPCKTPTLDPDWQKNKYLEKAANLVANWIKSQNIPGTKTEVLQLPGKAPFVYVEIPGQSDKTVMFYGHLDKMPESEGWNEGLEPWKPVLKNDCLYGRGGADDGYAAFTPVAVIKALREQNIPHARCVMLLETGEECGSPDFPDYLKLVEKQIGIPELLICCDAGGDNYDQLWCITSLRGHVVGILRVEMLTTGVHSGTASGIVPSTFRIARQLLSRIENENTGELLIKDLYVDIPKERLQQTKELAKIVGDKVYKELPFVAGAKPLTTDTTELLLNKNWRSTLSIIGAEGMPLTKDAGNVLRPMTALELAIRIPPYCDPEKITEKLTEILEKDPPYGAKVSFKVHQKFYGWDAPKMPSWLEQALQNASQTYFGAPTAYTGEGGSIGIIQMLSEKYPQTQFIITGLLGPESNAHGPNEALVIPAAKKLTCCIAEILASQCAKK